MVKLFVIMGLPWSLDIISAALGHGQDSTESFELRLALDVLNLLTGVLVFLVLVCRLDGAGRLRERVSRTLSRTLTSRYSAALQLVLYRV